MAWDATFNDPGIHIINIWVEDGCENESELEIEVEINPCGEVYCTYTQGFYGNAGGLTCQLETTWNFIDGKLPVMAGVAGSSLYFTTGQADCVIDVLPGGGPSKDLSTDPFSEFDLSYACASICCGGGQCQTRRRRAGLSACLRGQ